MKRNLPGVLAQLVRHAPPLLAQNFRPDCCIAATRVAVHVLTRFGFVAKPQPAQCIVYTKKLWRRVGGDTFSYPFQSGEWSVGLGFGWDKRFAEEPGSKGYDGHLVAFCSAPNSPVFIVDLSLGQAARPHKGIVLPPALFTPKQKVTLNGCVLMYRAIDNPKFTESPDWADASRTDPIIEELMEIIV